jgi:hypothetical protein
MLALVHLVNLVKATHKLALLAAVRGAAAVAEVDDQMATMMTIENQMIIVTIYTAQKTRTTMRSRMTRRSRSLDNFSKLSYARKRSRNVFERNVLRGNHSPQPSWLRLRRRHSMPKTRIIL